MAYHFFTPGRCGEWGAVFEVAGGFKHMYAAAVIDDAFHREV